MVLRHLRQKLLPCHPTPLSVGDLDHRTYVGSKAKSKPFKWKWSDSYTAKRELMKPLFRGQSIQDIALTN